MAKEFLVNSYRDNWQYAPAVTRLKNDSYVVVWESFVLEDGIDFYYIAAQRYTASGMRIGGEFIVDEDLLVRQGDGSASTNPTVTALKDGGFAVAWQNSEDGILGSTDAYTRAFDANGDARVNTARVHAPNGRDQLVPEISATKTGYVVSYASYDGANVNSADNVYLQRFDNDGDRVGGGTRINQYTRFDQLSPHSAELSNGRTIVIWDSEYGGRDIPGAAGLDGVRGRIYAPNGKALTREFMVSDDNGYISSAIQPDTSIDVAALSGGRFVATWYQTVLHKGRDTTYEIHARMFAQDGDALGREIVVRADSAGVPRHTSVIGLDKGGFAVAWDEPGAGFQFQEAYARVFSDGGTAISGKIKLNQYSGRSDQELPELAPRKDGGFFAVYESEFFDGDDDAIAGRMFEVGTLRGDRAAVETDGVYHALAGNDRVVGGEGANALHGGRGADVLVGGAGDDWISGGTGRDRLVGGEGGDRFVFGQVTASRPSEPDLIVDFDAARDVIVLSPIDADAGARGDQRFTFIGESAFSGDAGELRYKNGHLLGDVDGDGRADLRIDVAGLTPDTLLL